MKIVFLYFFLDIVFLLIFCGRLVTLLLLFLHALTVRLRFSLVISVAGRVLIGDVLRVTVFLDDALFSLDFTGFVTLVSLLALFLTVVTLRLRFVLLGLRFLSRLCDVRLTGHDRARRLALRSLAIVDRCLAYCLSILISPSFIALKLMNCVWLPVFFSILVMFILEYKLFAISSLFFAKLISKLIALLLFGQGLTCFLTGNFMMLCLVIVCRVTSGNWVYMFFDMLFINYVFNSLVCCLLLAFIIFIITLITILLRFY